MEGQQNTAALQSLLLFREGGKGRKKDKDEREREESRNVFSAFNEREKEE